MLEGEFVKLKCIIFGKLDSDIRWFKDGEEIYESDKFRMMVNLENICILII